MIPRRYITEWKKNSGWALDSQVEQDLIISRAIVEIYRNEFLASRLAFRGGTALHKLFLSPQKRYSEDIDLVQIIPEPISDIFTHIRESLSFLGTPNIKQSKGNNTLVFRFDSGIAPIVKLKLKIEINCREHFNVLGLEKTRYKIVSGRFTGNCDIITYKLEELLGTKLRALYQRNKGRDLYDICKALFVKNIDVEKITSCYKTYMKNSTGKLPSKSKYQKNLDLKMGNKEFLNDINALLKPGDTFDNETAYKLISEKLIARL